ncbi:hypothetical protein HKX48_005064 [Thoreauomyces humboldtii]|nr:hypothetical protein HKX48_005064 [Thoreauomyces humboldtii]
MHGIAAAVRSSSSEMSMNTKVYNIINALRELDKEANETEIMRLTAINVSGSNELRQLLSNNPKITYHPEKGTYQYKPKYNLRSKEDLLNLLHESRETGGTDMKELQDSWSGLAAAVQELKHDGDITVLTTKDEKPKILFWNDRASNVNMSPEFHEYWHKVQIPKEIDLAKELERAGLKSMEVFTTANKGDGQLKQSKRRSNKRIRLTNVHLEGLDLMGLP